MTEERIEYGRIARRENMESLKPDAPEDHELIKRKPLEFQLQIEQLIPTAGTIEISKDQEDLLYSPIQVEEVEIRPDGLIYLPWMEYVQRLRKAFGAQWTIIPQGMPKIQGNYVYWPFYLVIQGKIAGFAIGENQYHPSNAMMTYGDACEGAKSNALMRLCKGLGIGLELWKPSFARSWRKRYAEKYTEKGKVRWRRKGDVRENGEGEYEETAASSSSPVPVESGKTINDQDIANLAGHLSRRIEQLKDFERSKSYVRDLHLSKAEYGEIMDLIKKEKEITFDLVENHIAFGRRKKSEPENMPTKERGSIEDIPF